MLGAMQQGFGMKEREHFLPLMIDFLIFKTSGNSEIHWLYSYSEFKMFLEYCIGPSSHVGDPWLQVERSAMT